MAQFNSREYFADLVSNGSPADEARIHSEAIEEIVDQQQSIREDIRDLRDDLTNEIRTMRTEFQDEIRDMRNEMQASFAASKDRDAELRLEIEKIRSGIEHTKSVLLIWIIGTGMALLFRPYVIEWLK